MSDSNIITLIELDENEEIRKVTEFHGVHSATVKMHDVEYEIPVDMALSALQTLMDMNSEEEE